MKFSSYCSATILTVLGLPGLHASTTAQKPAKPKAPLASTAAQSAPASGSGTPIAKAAALRSATCTLILKGRTEVLMTVESPEDRTQRKKRIIEEFNYTLPGQLSETVHPNGETEFTFTPGDLKSAPGAEAKLHLEDDFPAPGWAPVAMDATSLQNAGPMVFKSLARGQNLIPVGGTVVNLNGRLRSLAPMTVSKSLGETENRPVASTPLPLLGANLRKPGLPVLKFQGATLWAWANTPGAFVLRGTIDYKNVQIPSATVNGSVDLTFQVGPVRKPVE